MMTKNAAKAAPTDRAAEPAGTPVRIQPIRPVRIALTITSTSPMIQHAWSEKALRSLRMTAAERKKQPKTARDPQAEGTAALYRTSTGDYAIPAMALKSAIVGAAHKDYGIEKTTVRKGLFLHAEDPSQNIPIECDEPRIREDMVRVGMSQTDLRYRPEFTKWSARVAFQVDRTLLTEEDLIALVERAGFSVGIGEWRPEKGGEYGRFQVDRGQPIETEAV